MPERNWTIGHLDVLLFFLVGILAITNALIPTGSWRSISFIIGGMTVARAALKLILLHPRKKRVA